MMRNFGKIGRMGNKMKMVHEKWKMLYMTEKSDLEIDIEIFKTTDWRDSGNEKRMFGN
jgi:hypothetical protein